MGLFLRWIATVGSIHEMTFMPSSTKQRIEGERCPSLTLYDKQGKSVTIAGFLGGVVVMKTWNVPGADLVIDRKVWFDFDDPQIVYLYVYTGSDLNVLREEPTPAWKKATSLLLVDREGELAKTFGQFEGPNCYVIDQHGFIKSVPRSQESSSSQWCDALIVKKLLTSDTK